MVDSGQQTGRFRTALPAEQSPKMSDLQGTRSANVRWCFAIRAIVIDTECPMGRGFQRMVVGPDDGSECKGSRRCS